MLQTKVVTQHIKVSSEALLLGKVPVAVATFNSHHVAEKVIQSTCGQSPVGSIQPQRDVIIGGNR